MVLKFGKMGTRIGNTTAIKAWHVWEGIYFKNESRVIRVMRVSGNDICVVSRTIDGVMEEKTVSLNELEPVLISEKWLRWFGFSPQKNCWRIGLYLFRPDGGILFKLYSDMVTVHYTVRINVRYVHEMQTAINSEAITK